MSQAPLSTLPVVFANRLSGLGFEERAPEPINAPCFPGEFNRCMEHIGIDRRLQGDRTALPERWYSVAPAVRTKDFGQVGGGRHSTAFEVLCALCYASPSKSEEERLLMSRTMLDFAEQSAGLTRDRMSFSLFGGGTFLGRQFKRDERWYEIWRQLGIGDHQLSWVPGPKLFVLFLGDRERCGPRCEVSYRSESLDTSPIEIGTLICDLNLVSTEGEPAFESSPEHAIGMALGVERLIGAGERAGIFDFDPYSSLIADLANRARFWADELMPDCRTLVDSLKASLFLKALTRGLLTESQRQFELQVLARAVRKGFMLGLPDGLEWHRQALERIARAYASRYPSFAHSVDDVLQGLARFSLAEAWNPAGYTSSHDRENRR